MGRTSRKIRIKGLVQGVGFRPFIYRLAKNHQLVGTVENNNTGVEILVEGKADNVEQFIREIPVQIPEASSISEFIVSKIKPSDFSDFTITKSQSLSDEITEVSPDIAVCKSCLQDMKNQPNRIGYPFTNCTNCGPRFTIIQDLPYDREKTTMRPFEMCPSCREEYTNILDRRFHAQPVACSKCGPHYTLIEKGEKETDISTIVKTTARLLEDGKIVAIKGLGGYHLACNPFNEKTVAELRIRKSREGKPFALMFRDAETAKQFLHINKKEETLLMSWRRPIVLLKIKEQFAPSVSTGLDTIGSMLPYMPFHHMLFEELDLPAIVLTSGNITDEPIIIDNQEAMNILHPIADASLTYNREIYNRTDDSVAFVANNKERLIRRSRSYAPSPVQIKLNAEGIFAAGAELVNCFCIGKGNQAIMSQHIGDLKNLETLEFYQESVERFKRLFRFTPQLAVADLHPDYLSTQFAKEMKIPILLVQHHHAHIASCMAEFQLDEKVIGISFDGTGLGDDGNIWGGEFLICDLNEYQRFTHFEYIPQPGGDAVSKHPWRMMLAYLHHYFGDEVVSRFPLLFKGIDEAEIEGILFLLKSKVNSPLTSSAGRLFDAVSALLNVCRNSTYHAEAPMRLEAIADEKTSALYGFEFDGQISFGKTFEEMIADLLKGEETAKIAGKFHNTIVQLIVEVAEKMRKHTGLNKVVLSGGTFQNKILLENVEQKLKEINFAVYSQSGIPSNDGGIALGQLAIAAKRRELEKLKPQLS
ncbi:MAG: carbamoyltransferase HypF [Bacteroidetes bacterium]|nr:MAG: carbamoyltransferase HypF [Bacteroidota bacterium]